MCPGNMTTRGEGSVDYTECSKIYTCIDIGFVIVNQHYWEKLVMPIDNKETSKAYVTPTVR